MKSILKLSFAILATFALAGQAQALPTEHSASFIPESTAKVDYEGILAIRAPFGGCSAALVRYESSLPSDKALALTNGHCNENGFIDAGTYILNKDSRMTFKVLNPTDGKTDIGKLPAEKIIYATMTKTDIALYRLTLSYEEIESRFGIRPLDIATRAPSVGTRIEIASGYWRRGYGCEIEATIPTLKEGDWTWKSSIRYSRPGCETIHGTSGSPVVEAGTREVIAINNTGSDTGGRCTVNNPCEVDRDGNITYEKGRSYGQQVYWLYSCLDESLNFDLGVPTCRLPGGALDSTDSIRVR